MKIIESNKEKYISLSDLSKGLGIFWNNYKKLKEFLSNPDFIEGGLFELKGEEQLIKLLCSERGEAKGQTIVNNPSEKTKRKLKGEG